jgi:predicted Ser/Thr protein kinase
MTVNIDLNSIKGKIETYIDNYYNYNKKSDNVYDMSKYKKSENNFRYYKQILQGSINSVIMQNALNKLKSFQIKTFSKKNASGSSSGYNSNVIPFIPFKCVSQQIHQSQILTSNDDTIIYKFKDKNVAKVIKVTNLEKYIKISSICKYNIADCIKNVIDISNFVHGLGIGPKIYTNGICKIDDNNLFHYIEMEHIDGRPLNLFLEDDNNSDSIKKEILKKVNNQLTQLRKKSIIHNDFDSKNFMVVTKDGKYEIKIIDYNLSESYKFKAHSDEVNQIHKIFEEIYNIDLIDYVVCSLLKNNDVNIKLISLSNT